MIPALVLTAGLATRLRPLSRIRAKAALPVAGEPLVRRILKRLAHAGVEDVVLNLHHLPHTLTTLVGNGADLGLRVRYSWETEILGTAGGPRHALPLLDAPTFLIANGDTLTDIDIQALVDSHRASGALVTMAAIPNTQPDKYRGLVTDDRGILTGYAPPGSGVPSYHFVGLQVAEAEVFASLPDNAACETVDGLYPPLIGAGDGSLRVFVSSGECLDIGTPADYLQTSLLIAARERKDSIAGNRVTIAPDARIEDSVLWDDVELERGVNLRECIVTDGVRLPADTVWTRVTIRVDDGELLPEERRVGRLLACSL
jgi:NDP-sugar pyrophosphorylase family protein